MRQELLELQTWGQGSHPPGWESKKTSWKRQHLIWISALKRRRIFFLITNSFVFDVKNKYMFIVENLGTVEECEKENKNQLLSSPNKSM